ncbi:hypothetical protein J6590_078165 [Homalodisca vitripennis]|nr:hypothetical protein J6590_078165 [Homalodisca vitripennis]
MAANEPLPIAIHVNARRITPTGMSSAPRSHLRASSVPRHQYPGLLLVSPYGRDKTCGIINMLTPSRFSEPYLNQDNKYLQNS